MEGRPIWFTILVLACAPAASAHGDLTVNELEILAIRDFEGQEDSFAWEGWEIWDVYVGEGYSADLDSDGVYFKVNFAGDGTSRPTSSQVWALTFSFNVGEQAFVREISHDGAEVTSDFEELEWQIADGNVFQVRAWVPVPDWEGQSVSDIVIVSSVDGEPRDTAPGGIHVPGTGTEIPVEGPGTPVFPPLGEGRIVESVPLTGPGKFLNVSIAPGADGTFEFTVDNPLKEQGQHIIMVPAAIPGWSVTPADWGANLDAGRSATGSVVFTPTTDNGSLVAPLRLDLLTDIGGRQTFYAFIEDGQVAIVQDPAQAQEAPYGSPSKDSPGVSLLPLSVALAVALVLRSAVGRR